VLGGGRVGGTGSVNKRGVRGSGAGDDEDAGGRLDPFSGVVDAGVGADGADDGAGGHADAIGAFQEIFEDEAEIALAVQQSLAGCSTRLT
jgi:hypothetical protein